MFKLVKINGSRNNCPEFVRFLTANSDVPLVDGSLVIRDGMTVTICEKKPEYLIVGNYEINKNYELVAYAVTPEMIFRTFCYILDREPLIGDRVDIYANEYSVACGVSLNEEGCGRVLDVNKINDDLIYVDVCFDGR